MRVGISLRHKRNLGRAAALLVLGGLAAGCSSGTGRFTDETFTSSTTPIARQNQPVIDPSAVAGTGDIYTPPVSSSADRARPVDMSSKVGRSALPAATASAEPVVRRTEQVAMATRTIDPLSRAEERVAAPARAKVKSVEESVSKPRIASADPAGWSSAGGSQVTAKEGETVFNLSRRYGVPADVLMRVNGIDSGGGLRVGQKVLIPTYIYSDRAPVSAPDNNPRVADAKSSRGTKYDVPAGKIPLPSDAPKEKLAVLPSTPRAKEKAAATETASADTKKKTAKGAYTVASGDTLSSIARKNGVSVSALKAANGGGDSLRIGQQVKIPASGDTAVAAAKPAKIDPVETASTGAKSSGKLASAEKPQLAAYTPPVKSKAIEAVESESSDAAPSSTGIDRMRWPVKGRVAKSRDGIDIAVPEGTAVKAAENGVVIYAGDGLKDFGNTVLVRHDNGLVTVYGHADTLNVKRGQKVKRGEQIATAGTSGQTDAPKLHFEVRKNSAPVDPAKYLE